MILSGAVAIIFTLFIVSLFTTKSPLSYLCHELFNRVFLTLKPIITSDSLTFWRLFIFKKDTILSDPLLIRNLTILGYLVYLVVSIISFSVVKKINLESIFAALFISSFGGWLFLTSMHERYLFTGIISLLFLSIYKAKYFLYFVILSTIYLIGMYLAFPGTPIPFFEKQSHYFLVTCSHKFNNIY